MDHIFKSLTIFLIFVCILPLTSAGLTDSNQDLKAINFIAPTTTPPTVHDSVLSGPWVCPKGQWRDYKGRCREIVYFQGPGIV